MPVTIEEKIDSRELSTGSSASGELRYIIQGTDSEFAAQAALAGVAPDFYDTLPLQSLHVETFPESEFIWEGTARYARSQNTTPPETGDSTFSFDTGGGTQHITQSLETSGSFAAPGEVAPDFKSAIGVTHDNVEGVDITIPTYNFSETHYLADAVVTPAYRIALFNLTGKVNSDGFRGFAAGEVLFLGASGTKRGDDDWEIAFRFAASQNKTALQVGEIVGIDKKGWEYMWVRYADDVDDVAKALIKKPIAVYVEKVYDDASFAGLGIGS